MRGSLFALSLLAASPGVAQEAPASAIPWLSDSLAERPTPTRPSEPAATPLTSRDVTTMPLGQTRRDAVGILPPSVTRLPRNTFAGSDPARVAELVMDLPSEGLPAMQDLVLMLLLAEVEPPRAATDTDALFFARVDGLLRFGALEQAQALMERAGSDEPRAFRRWWDISLLTGFDARACEAMTGNPAVAPTLPARIFCLTRTGDWAAAMLTLDTGRALDQITEEEDALLFRFLDPEQFEGEPPPIPPRPMTPLAFRLLDGLGETPSTVDLPLAFAVSDLRSTIGWKAQIEAAERLVRARALDPNRLLALYTEGRPSASGGVWDRAAAVQAFELAMAGADAPARDAALTRVMDEMSGAGLLLPLATLYGDKVVATDWQGPAALDALRLGLLSPAPSAAAERAAETLPSRLTFAVAVARGDLNGVRPTGALQEAIVAGFTGAPPKGLTELVEQDRLGEALLTTVRLLKDRDDSSPKDVAGALAFLRSVEMDSLARRTALQLLLL